MLVASSDAFNVAIFEIANMKQVDVIKIILFMFITPIYRLRT